VRRLAVPADIQRGDAVSEDRPSGPRDALWVRTITTDGRKLALDARLLSASAEDHPGSKINALAVGIGRDGYHFFGPVGASSPVAA
jgi:hypothetical protein